MALLLTAGVVVAPPPVASTRLSFSRTEDLGGGIGGVSVSPHFPSLSMAATSPLKPLPSVYCGRGDRKTAKGKRFNHSFGNARPRNKKKGRGPPRVPAPPAPPRKDKFDDGEIIKIEINESLFS